MADNSRLGNLFGGLFGGKAPRKHAPRTTVTHTQNTKNISEPTFGLNRIFTTGNATIERIDDTMGEVKPPIFKVTVSPESAFVMVNDTSRIYPGATVSGELIAWIEDGEGEARVRISRFGGQAPNEQTVVTRTLRATPISIHVSHTFENMHDGARIQIDTRNHETTFYIAKLKLY